MFETKYDERGIMGGLFSVVSEIQKNKSNPQNAFGVYEQARNEILSLPISDSIPALLTVLNRESWQLVCLSSLFLGAICQNNISVIRGVHLERIMDKIATAYEPIMTVDDGATAGAKTLALAMLEDKEAIQKLQAYANQSGSANWQEAGTGLHVGIIMTIANGASHRP